MATKTKVPVAPASKAAAKTNPKPAAKPAAKPAVTPAAGDPVRPAIKVSLPPVAKLSAKAAPKTSVPVAAKPHVNRPNVISFRVSDQQHDTLELIFNRDLTSGVNSIKQLARKVVVDYVAGRLTYKNPADKLKDFDLVR